MVPFFACFWCQSFGDVSPYYSPASAGESICDGPVMQHIVYVESSYLLLHSYFI